MMRSLALATLILVAGCERQTSLAERKKLAQLSAAAGCEDVESAVRAQLLKEMNEQLDRNLDSALRGGNCWNYETFYAASAAGGDAANSTSRSSSGASQYSTTNNQVAGVDEADIVKNDAKYIYALGAGKLNIIEAWPAETAHVVSRVAINGTPKKLFVEHGRAVVLSSVGATGADARYGWNRECTYGYDCSFTGDGQPLQVSVFDLSDLANPRLVRETRFSGSLIASRRIGDAVHVVVSAKERIAHDWSSWPANTSVSCEPVTDFQAMQRVFTAFESLRAENRKKIEQLSIADMYPSVVDTRHEAGGDVVDADLLAGCRNFYTAPTKDGASFLSLASFDLARSEPMNVTTVVGRPGAVYASADSLYVATRHQYSGDGMWFSDGASKSDEATTVHRFAFTEGPASAYQGTAIVKGRVLNQFAMDEHDGYFRLATTTGHLPSASVHSTVTVLEQSEQGLETVGVLDHLAPSEDIRSARFDGSRLFVVTFKKTDPLFVIDLADPKAPRVTGELKIPGFSTYMHMLDDGHLLSIGYDAEDHGSFAYFQGVLLQIFDVSDPSNPTLSARHVIGTRGSSSEALTNHLAFNYFAPRKLLAVPMAVCEASNGGGSYGQKLTFGGLMVFGISTETGFDYRGGVPHAAPAESRSACSNWWTNASSQVKRSIFMDDWVFSIASDLIQVAPISALGTPVVSLPLE